MNRIKKELQHFIASNVKNKIEFLSEWNHEM